MGIEEEDLPEELGGRGGGKREPKFTLILSFFYFFNYPEVKIFADLLTLVNLLMCCRPQSKLEPGI